MQLKDKIYKISPRERSGSFSGGGFSFQYDWSICQLLQIHLQNSNYLLIFDWHEDLLILDSEIKPKKISFNQIKGKGTGEWKISHLIEAGKDKNGKPKLSILGKLYNCKIQFKADTLSLNFISNMHFDIELAKGGSSKSKSDIRIDELKGSVIKKIHKSIKEEHGLTKNPVLKKITFLKTTDLSYTDSKTHVVGVLSEFLEKSFPRKKFIPSNVYRMVFEEVKRRAQYRKDIKALSDIHSYKGISRTTFDQMIVSTGINYDYDEIWNRIEIALNGSKMNFRSINKLRDAWKRLELYKMSPSKRQTETLIEKIHSKYNEIECSGKCTQTSLVDSVKAVYDSFLASNTLPTGIDEYFVKAIILSKYYE